MKRPRRYVVLLVLLAIAMVVVIVGCAHPQRRNDWRNPPQVCASDAECPSGKCEARDGDGGVGNDGGSPLRTCTPSALPALPPGRAGEDGGVRSPGPGPSIQPSSSDIQI